MTGTLSQGEETQLLQTIEMFEVITESQPQDTQSLEILKEAYLKLEREEDVIRTSRRIAQAHVHLGQLSSAILEYESILQRHPDDVEVLSALGEIEAKANSLSTSAVGAGGNAPVEELAEDPLALDEAIDSHLAPAFHPARPASGKPVPADLDDGREAMHKLFVETKSISNGDFELNWVTPDVRQKAVKPFEPFVQLLAEKGTMPVEKALKMIAEKTRLGYLPIDKYDVDMDLARTFPPETCLRWCVLPFDRMSKSILVATANPFNRQAAKELERATQARLLWYLAPPADIIKWLRRAFRT